MEVINNTRPEVIERRVERTYEDSSGWAAAVLILLAVVLFGFLFWWRAYHVPAAASTAPSTNINVSVPSQDSSIPGNAAGAGQSPSATPTPTPATNSAQPTQ